MINASDALKISNAYKERLNLDETIFQTIMNTIEADIKVAAEHGRTSIELNMNDIFFLLETKSSKEVQVAMVKSHPGGFNHSELNQYETNIKKALQDAGYEVVSRGHFVTTVYAIHWGE